MFNFLVLFGFLALSHASPVRVGQDAAVPAAPAVPAVPAPAAPAAVPAAPAGAPVAPASSGR